MSTPFARPSSGGDKFEPKDFIGALVIVFPKSYNPNETTKFGPSTSADVDIVVVDRQDPATGQPVFVSNARLFGNLANSVRDSLGSQVLGRIGQTPTDKGNPAWVLTDVLDNPQEVAAAMGPLALYQAGQFKPAQPPQQAPPANTANYQASQAQDPWAGVNATPPPQYQQPAAGASPVQGQFPAQTAPPAQQQYQQPQNTAPAAPYQAPAPAAAAASPSPGGDPVTAFLVSRGLSPDAVAAMDPNTRQGVYQQLGGQ